MIKKYFLFILIAAIVASCSDQQQQKVSGLSIKDDLGNSISFSKPPQRIITLAPNLTEMIYDLGLGNNLVGNTTYCDYPAAARNVDKVGDMLTFNFEKIVTLKPDIVFITVEGNTKETYDKFRELGIKIFVSNPRNFTGIKKTYLDLGKIFGIEEKAKRKVTGWDSLVTKLSTESKNYHEGSAMFLIDTKPVMLAGKNTFINEYLEICGLKNIAADSPLNYPMFSREEILRRNPDYIIYPEGNNEDFSRVLKIYPEWKNLKAVKNHHVLFVDRNLFTRPGPRFVQAVGILFNLLHPTAK
ncbi:MAG: cobalamin-binding protein [Bacteroidetes bacterium]|nr:cobalamin-binding protein [Bacteroidota bacterium]